MSNQQLIKSAHIWFLAALLACGLLVVAGKAGIKAQEQNSNRYRCRSAGERDNGG